MTGSPRVALLFGGQGEEQRELARGGELRPSALVTRAGERLGIDLPRAVALGSPELLRTEVAQPLLVATSLETLRELEQQGFVPTAIAGHSLGEIPAFVAAGCLDAEEAVDLACARGTAMARAARSVPGGGGMAALPVSDPDDLGPLLAAARRSGPVDVAARNSPVEWVLSGARAALASVEATRRVIRLPVDGPWHSTLMDAARQEWLAELGRVTLRPPARLLVTNRTGLAVTPEDNLRELLAGQLTRPVEWVRTMQTLESMEISEVVLVGSVRILRGLCRANVGTRWKVRSAREWLLLHEA